MCAVQGRLQAETRKESSGMAGSLVIGRSEKHARKRGKRASVSLRLFPLDIPMWGLYTEDRRGQDRYYKQGELKEKGKDLTSKCSRRQAARRCNKRRICCARGRRGEGGASLVSLCGVMRWSERLGGPCLLCLMQWRASLVLKREE